MLGPEKYEQLPGWVIKPGSQQFDSEYGHSGRKQKVRDSIQVGQGEVAGEEARQKIKRSGVLEIDKVAHLPPENPSQQCQGQKEKRNPRGAGLHQPHHPRKGRAGSEKNHQPKRSALQLKIVWEDEERALWSAGKTEKTAWISLSALRGCSLAGPKWEIAIKRSSCSCRTRIKKIGGPADSTDDLGRLESMLEVGYRWSSSLQGGRRQVYLTSKYISCYSRFGERNVWEADRRGREGSEVPADAGGRGQLRGRVWLSRMIFFVEVLLIVDINCLNIAKSNNHRHSQRSLLFLQRDYLIVHIIV